MLGKAIVRIIILALVPLTSFATTVVPQMFTLDGQLTQVGTNLPLLDNNLKITIQIMDSSKTCLLYEETQQPIDTTATNGYYNILVGSGIPNAKRTVNDPTLSMVQIFQNAAAVTANNVPGQTCAGGIYTPTGGATRYFRLIVTPSATNIADTLLPDTIIDSVPNALVAESIQGLGPTNLLQVKTSGSNVLTQTNLENVFTTTNYPNLMSLLSVPSTSTVVQTPTNGGASLPSIAGNPSSPAVGQIWYDSGSNVLKYYDGAVKTLSSGAAIGNQSANTFYAGPTSGGAAAPSFRALTVADLPVTGATGSFVNGGNSFGVAGNLGTSDNFDLNFKTNNSTKMTILSGGNVGIGTTTPLAALHIKDLSTTTDMLNVEGSNSGGGSFRIDSWGNAYFWGGMKAIYSGTYASSALDGGSGDLYLITTTNNKNINLMPATGGNVGIGTQSPSTALQVANGSIVGTSNAVTSTVTTIDWRKGNVQYTPDSCQAYTFNNILDGGSYTFVVKGSTSGTCTFTSAGLTYHFVQPNAATVAATHTMYTFFRAGTDVYVSWVSGL